MKRSPRPRNTPAKLSETVHRQLSLYALAASAAGVGALVLSSPAQAEIVYTPAHATLFFFYKLDLNHDGIPDFTIGGVGRNCMSRRSGTTTCTWNLPVYSAPKSNAIAGKSYLAAALRPGAEIGPKRKRWDVGYAILEREVSHYNAVTRTSKYYGPWANGISGKGFKNRYLGLKFLINGKFHYGWARVDTTGGILGVLTGYAYETVPDRPIIAGQTKGTFVGSEEERFGPDGSQTNPVPNPPQVTSLGMLALGAQSVPLRRRKGSVLEGD